MLWRRGAPEKGPQVLAEQARQMLISIGYGGAVAHRAAGFEADLAQLRYLQQGDPVHWRSAAPGPSVLRFWYRESPRPFEAWRFLPHYGNVSRVTADDPPHTLAGMALVTLDTEGRLTKFVVVPAGEAPATSAMPVDWTAVLSRAGFDPSSWRSAEPQRLPPVFADTRAAWRGTWPSRPDLPVRLEAAAAGGRPVYFEAIYPWTPAARSAPKVLAPGERGAIAILLAALAVTAAAAIVFARRHVRAGRGDRRGAARLSVFVFLAMMVSWLFGERHAATLHEVAVVAMALAWGLLAATFCWAAYLAVEPVIRRHWPESLVSWARLLRGDLRDPLVGRDLLVGCAAGPVLAAIGAVGTTLPERFGLPTDLVFADAFGLAYGAEHAAPLLVWRAAQSVLAALASLFLLVLLRLLLREPWSAIAAFVLGAGIIAGSAGSHFGVGFVNTAVLVLPFVLLLVRYGLLAAVTQFYVWGLFIFFPVTWDLSAWYAGTGVAALIVFAVLVSFGFTAALAGRPAFGHPDALP
jgi:serine/threonine-protein kinase